MNTLITMPAKYLFGIVAFAAKSDIRYYLETVKFEVTDQQKRMIATDGHRLVSIPLVHDDVEIYQPFEMMVPVSAVDQLRKQLSAKQRKNSQVSILFTGEGDQYQLLCDGAIVLFVPVSGTYPDVDRVIPSWSDLDEQEHSKEFAFNWDYMADFQTFAKLITDNKMPRVVLVPGENTSAARVRFEEPYNNIVAVIMPQRIR